MDLLRFITAGSVDDGKSTLIGRLLYDSKNILADQLEAIERSSKNGVNGDLDLALLTDGLRAEREQGITIDVAYRYFSTPKRKFIIADAPGHIQYTRNMITGASNVNLAVILIDARNGVEEQTKRHSIITSLLQVQHVVVAVNKMDLVGYSEDVFQKIVNDFISITKELEIKDVAYIPVSALSGDNIVNRSYNMPWYGGKTLLQFLEEVPVDNTQNLTHSRFQVQYIIRPQQDDLHDYRGYAGKVISGVYKKGDKVKVFPAGIETTIERIEVGGSEVEEAFAPQSITILLKNDIDISRGDSIVKVEEDVEEKKEFEVLISWLHQKPLQLGNTYLLQHNSRRVKAIVRHVEYKIDVNTLNKITGIKQVELNEVVKATIKTAAPLVVDAYKDIQANGAAILIDETANDTVGAVLFQ
jgi:sulfate adenylyltransferase subunit 1